MPAHAVVRSMLPYVRLLTNLEQNRRRRRLSCIHGG